MKTINKFLLLASLSLFPLLTKAVEIQATSTPVFVNWTANATSDLTVNLTLLDNPGGVFASITFDLLYYTDGTDPQWAVVQVDTNTNDKVTFTDNYLRSGTQVMNSLTYGQGVQFLSGIQFVNGAQPGTDNYLGVKFLDTNLDAHYGWIQFDLNAFADEAPAVTFVSGYVNDAPNTGAIAGGGAVPEPSALALLAAAGAGLALIARSRRK